MGVTWNWARDREHRAVQGVGADLFLHLCIAIASVHQRRSGCEGKGYLELEEKKTIYEDEVRGARCVM